MPTLPNAFAPLPVYPLKRSLYLRAGLMFLPTLTILFLVITPGLSAELIIAAVLITLTVSAHSLWHHWPGAPGAPVGIAPAADNRCILIHSNGEERMGECVDAWVSATCLVISLQMNSAWRWSRRSVIVPCDALCAESHRQLRRWAQSR